MLVQRRAARLASLLHRAETRIGALSSSTSNTYMGLYAA